MEINDEKIKKEEGDSISPKKRLFQKITNNSIGLNDIAELLECEKKCPTPAYCAGEKPYEFKYLSPSERFDIEYGVPIQDAQIFLRKVFLFYLEARKSSFSKSVLLKNHLEKQDPTDVIKVQNYICSEVILGFFREKIKIIKSLKKEFNEDNKPSSLYSIGFPIISCEMLAKHLLEDVYGIGIFRDGVNFSFGCPGTYTEKIIFCKRPEGLPAFVIRTMNEYGYGDINPLRSLRYNRKFRELCGVHLCAPSQFPCLVQLARTPVENRIKCNGIFKFTNPAGVVKYGSISHCAKGEELSRVLYNSSDPGKILEKFGNSIRNFHDAGGVHGDLSRRNIFFNRKTGVVTLIDLVEMCETLRFSVGDRRLNDLFRYYFYEFARFASESYKKSDAEILIEQDCRQFMCILNGYVKTQKEKDFIFSQFSMSFKDLEDISKLIKMPAIQQRGKFLNGSFWRALMMRSIRRTILDGGPYYQNRIDIAKSIFSDWYQRKV